MGLNNLNRFIADYFAHYNYFLGKQAVLQEVPAFQFNEFG